MSRFDVQALLKKSISLVPWRFRNAVKSIPFIAPLQRWLLERFLEGREFVHTVDAGPARGLNYPIKLPEDKGIWLGTYELELATQIAAAVQPGDICLDVGGWHGFFGGVMALAGAERVFIFEPLPANIAQIRRMMQLNPQLSLDLIDAAVGDKDGTIEFCVMRDSSMGKVANSSFQQENQSHRQIQVRVTTLDQWSNRGTDVAPSVIKIDVEGAELLVLRGGHELLAARKPRLFIEAHSHSLAGDCQQLLEQLDYDVHTLESSEREICHLVASPRWQR